MNSEENIHRSLAFIEFANEYNYDLLDEEGDYRTAKAEFEEAYIGHYKSQEEYAKEYLVGYCERNFENLLSHHMHNMLFLDYIDIEKLADKLFEGPGASFLYINGYVFHS